MVYAERVTITESALWLLSCINMDVPVYLRHFAASTSLTMTRLTRETALALMLSTAMDPSMCKMMLPTVARTITAAQMFRPKRRRDTTNTAPVGQAGESRGMTCREAVR